MGKKRRFDSRPITSGFPRQADIFGVRRDVSKVPIGDLLALKLRSNHREIPINQPVALGNSEMSAAKKAAKKTKKTTKSTKSTTTKKEM
jgi:hypothetical protein